MPSQNSGASPDLDLSSNDLGPLAWVMDELRKSLDSAVKAFRRFVRDAEAARGTDLENVDASQLRIARQQLYQGVGALEMVGQSAPALMLRALESLAQKFIARPELCSAEAVAKVERAGFALVEYLDGVIAGRPVSAVGLFSQYRDVQALAGADRVHPADLWSQEWRWIDAGLQSGAAPIGYDPSIRKKMDLDVLRLFKAGDLSAAVRLSERCVGLSLSQQAQQPRVFWQLAAGVFEALAAGLWPLDLYAKRAVSRVLLQYSTLAKGEMGVSDRLARDLLFFCAQSVPLSPADSSPLHAVRLAYGLARHRPVDYEAPQFGRFDPAVVAQARKRIVSAKEAWSALSGGELSKIKASADAFSLVGDSLVRLHPESKPLAQALGAAMQDTQAANAVPTTGLAMEVATSMLYLEAVFADLDLADSQLTARMMRLAERLQRARQGGEPEALDAWMEELYRQVSDRQTMGSVVGELRTAMHELEKSLDAYFREPTNKNSLRDVPSQLAQMRGVLSVLGLDQASAAVQSMRDRVEGLMVTEVNVDQARAAGTFDKLGNSLGALGFMIDMLNYQPALARKLFVFDEEADELKPLMGRASDALTDAVSAVTISKDLLQAADQPAGQQALSDQLDTLAINAALAEQNELARAARAAAQSAAQHGAGSVVQDLATAFQSIAPPPLESGMQALDLEEDDLREIFLEEGREVVAAAAEALAALAQDPGDLSVQATLRRAYHTLKGSSRMVGLDTFGEAAWALEQVFNAWLPEQKPATPELLELANSTMAAFGRWVEDLALDQADAWTAAPFQAAALAFREGKPLPTLPKAQASAVAAPGPGPAAASNEPPAPELDPAAQQSLDAAAERAAQLAQLNALFEADSGAKSRASQSAPPSWESTEVASLDGMAVTDPGSDADQARLLAEFSDTELQFVPSVFPEGPGGQSDAATQLMPIRDIDFQSLAQVSGNATSGQQAGPQAVGDSNSLQNSLQDLDALNQILEDSRLGLLDASANAAGPTDSADLPALPDFAATQLGRPMDSQPTQLMDGLPAFQSTELAHGLPDFQPTDISPELVDQPHFVESVPLLGDAEFDFEALGQAKGESNAVMKGDPPEPGAALAPDTIATSAPNDPAPQASEAEDQVKVIGDLRIGIPLYNVYLNEADEWSRRLVTDLGEWAMELHQPVPDSAVATSHSLAGSSATVGFTALSGLARALEHALMHVQRQARGLPQQAAVFMQAADDIRHLLHQFAAGFLKEPADGLIDALKAIEDSAIVEAPDTGSEAQELGLVAPAAAVVTTERHLEEEFDVQDALDPDLLPVFEDEARELLPQLASAMRQWVGRPDNQSARAEVLRHLHTLKGSARLAGALRLGELAHRMESAIERLDHEGLQAQQIEPLLGRVDQINGAFEALGEVDLSAAGHQSVEMAALRAEAPISGGSGSAELVPTALAESGPRDSAQATEQAPTSDAALLQAAARSTSGSAAPWAPVAGAAVSTVAPARAASAGVQAVRVRAQLLDRLVNQAGEVMMTRSRLQAGMGQLRGSLTDLTDNLDRLREQLRDVELQAETQMQSRLAQSKDNAAGFDPLEFDRFTRMQELTRMMAESVNDVATVQRNLQRAVESTEDNLVAQGRQARELQRDLLKTRMVEFEGISERLYRVVRQASKDAAKQVRLDIAGGSIEIDRGVLERMTPAFEHLLRNCVAHGIEAPQQRSAVGKDSTGLISIAVQQDGNDVSVRFRDDGAGLNLARIREKALAQGLVQPEQAVSDEEAAQLIFMPGFSTASEVTELAGRGIGMDVVRAEVNALGGRIETQTAAGQGTEFRLILPLTTAVTQVVMVRSGSLSFGVPANLVEVVRRVPGTELERSYNNHTFDDGIEQIPFFWSGALLQASTRSTEPPTRTTPVAIFRSAAQRVAVHIDEVLGNQEVVVKNLGQQLSRLPGLTGMSVLASGAVVLIYNPVALATVYGESAQQMFNQPVSAEAEAPTVAVAAAEAVPQVPLVLVVDDSITVRRVTQRFLQREGYRVVMAADGLQALERLQGERPQVVLSDIEMPRMDGFDLVRNIRADDRIKDLPVIMITSRIAEKHREHAKALGVDHYLGKPYSEEELLRLVRHYCADFFTTA